MIVYCTGLSVANLSGQQGVYICIHEELVVVTNNV
jgi:hypothetical protein